MNPWGWAAPPTQVEVYKPVTAATDPPRPEDPPIIGPPPIACPSAGASVTVHVLTSFSPDPAAADLQRRSVESWRAAGCEVVAFQAARELRGLSRTWPVRWIDVPDAATGLAMFGRPYIPISHMTEWATRTLPADDRVLLLNADNRLVAPPPMLRDLAALAGDGLCYIHRHDVDPRTHSAARQPHGIDGFLFRADSARLVPRSWLCIAKPAWDWMVPWAFMHAKRRLFTPRFPMAYHKTHPLRWSSEDHRVCIAELARLAGRPVGYVDHGMWQEFRRWVVPVDVNPEWSPVSVQAPADL